MPDEIKDGVDTPRSKGGTLTLKSELAKKYPKRSDTGVLSSVKESVEIGCAPCAMNEMKWPPCDSEVDETESNYSHDEVDTPEMSFDALRCPPTLTENDGYAIDEVLLSPVSSRC